MGGTRDGQKTKNTVGRGGVAVGVFEWKKKYQSSVNYNFRCAEFHYFFSPIIIQNKKYEIRTWLIEDPDQCELTPVALLSTQCLHNLSGWKRLTTQCCNSQTPTQVVMNGGARDPINHLVLKSSGLCWQIQPAFVHSTTTLFLMVKSKGTHVAMRSETLGKVGAMSLEVCMPIMAGGTLVNTWGARENGQSPTFPTEKKKVKGGNGLGRISANSERKGGTYLDLKYIIVRETLGGHRIPQQDQNRLGRFGCLGQYDPNGKLESLKQKNIKMIRGQVSPLPGGLDLKEIRLESQVKHTRRGEHPRKKEQKGAEWQNKLSL